MLFPVVVSLKTLLEFQRETLSIDMRQISHIFSHVTRFCCDVVILLLSPLPCIQYYAFLKTLLLGYLFIKQALRNKNYGRCHTRVANKRVCTFAGTYSFVLHKSSWRSKQAEENT